MSKVGSWRAAVLLQLCGSLPAYPDWASCLLHTIAASHHTYAALQTILVPLVLNPTSERRS